MEQRTANEELPSVETAEPTAAASGAASDAVQTPAEPFPIRFSVSRTEADVRAYYRTSFRNVIGAGTFLLALIVLPFLINDKRIEEVLFALVIICLSYIRILFNLHRNRKKEILALPAFRTDYEVYEDRMLASVVRNGEVILTNLIYKGEAERVWGDAERTFFLHGGRAFTLHKSTLKAHPHLHTILYTKIVPKKRELPPLTTLQKALHIALLVASVIVFPVFVFLLMFGFPIWQVCFLLLVPIGSIVYALLLYRKTGGHMFVSNLIVGGIFLLLSILLALVFHDARSKGLGKLEAERTIYKTGYLQDME